MRDARYCRCRNGTDIAGSRRSRALHRPCSRHRADEAYRNPVGKQWHIRASQISSCLKKLQLPMVCPRHDKVDSENSVKPLDV